METAAIYYKQKLLLLGLLIALLFIRHCIGQINALLESQKNVWIL